MCENEKWNTKKTDKNSSRWRNRNNKFKKIESYEIICSNTDIDKIENYATKI